MRHVRGPWRIALGLAFGTLVSVSLVAGEVAEVPLVGLDQEGNALETSISAAEYVSRLSTATDAILNSTVEALGGQKLSGGAKPWRIRTVVVGAAAELEAGIGPILKLKAVPRFRVAFSDSYDPALP